MKNEPLRLVKACDKYYRIIGNNVRERDFRQGREWLPHGSGGAALVPRLRGEVEPTVGKRWECQERPFFSVRFMGTWCL